jgi:hypothetical protein
MVVDFVFSALVVMGADNGYLKKQYEHYGNLEGSGPTYKVGKH